MVHEKPFRFLTGFAAVVFLGMAAIQWAQVVAGSPEDKAYQAISRETDPKKRIELLDAFLKNFPKTPDLAQVYEFYSLSYRELGNADKEIEYAEKSLALRKDPPLMVMLGRVLAIKGDDLPKAIQTIKESSALAAKIRDNPPPGISAKEWQQTQDGVISTAKQLLDYAIDRYKQVFLNTLTSESDPDKIISMLNQYTAIVDDPENKPLLYNHYLRSYLRLGNRTKVLEYADKALAINPDNVEVLAFTTSAYLEKPMDLDSAMAQAQRAVIIADALDSKPKPAGLTDEIWAKQKTLWKSLAYSTRGLVELQKETTIDAAVTDLEKARDWSPTDAVVQYRLGIAYWKSKRIDDSIQALARSAVLPSGIQPQAAQLLETYYKAAHNGSTDGLKELLEKSKEPPQKPNGI